MISSRRVAGFLSTYRFPLALFLFLRVWTLAWASFSILWWQVPPENTARFYYGASPLADSILAPWQRWDSIWYTIIAERGYSPENLSTAYFPLYPLLIRFVIKSLPINSIAAGLLISSVATLAGFTLLYRMVREQAGETVAKDTLLCLATYPAGFFLFAVYAESVFLLLLVASWTSAQKQRWMLAGILAGLVALTRAQGILFLLPLAWIFGEQLWRGQVQPRRALCLLPAIGGSFLFLIYLFQVSGSLNAWLEIESLWHRFAWPWEPLAIGLQLIFTSGHPDVKFLNSLDVGLSLLSLVLIVRFFKNHRIPEGLVIAITILPSLFGVTLLSDYLPLASATRYLVVAFPFFVALGQIKLKSPLPQIIALASLLIQTVMLLAFSQWHFVE